MANFLAMRIINDKMSYADVPKSLKEQVKEILIEKGYEHLVVEA